MPLPPNLYHLYRWKRLPYQERLRLFASVHIDATAATTLMHHPFMVEDHDYITRGFGPENIVTFFGGLWYFPRELVVEVKGSAPRKPRKRHARTT